MGSHYVWFDHYDMCQLELPRLNFIARSIHQGHFPLWDPHSWAGLPVLGVGLPGAAYPLNLLFSTLPLEGGTIPVATLNWLFLAMRFVGAWFFYLLCRDLGLARLPAMLGAIAFSCCGYFGSAPWLDIGNGISCTPIVFLFAMRLWSGWRPFQSAVLLGAAIGLSWLSGHHEVPLIISYAVLLGSLLLAACRSIASRRPHVRVLAWTASAFVLAAAVSAVQTAPLYEFGHHARRWVETPEPIGWDQEVPYSVHAKFSLPWRGVAGLLVPSATPEGQTTAFVGLTIAVLAVFGVISWWRTPSVRTASYLGLGGLAYALGASTPIHRVLYTLLPMLDKARLPVRGLFLVTFAVSLLAAFGAQAFLTEGTRRRRLALAVLVGVAAVFVLARASGLLSEMDPAAPSHYLLKGLIAAGTLALLLQWASNSALNRRVSGAVLISLVLLEASAVSRLRMTALDRAHSVCATALVEHKDIADRLRGERDVGRIRVERDEVMTSLGDLYGFDQLTPFASGAPAGVLRHELHTPRTQALFGVTHYVGKTVPPAGATLLGTFRGGIRLFRQPGALPRAWVAHTILRVRDENELRTAIQNPAIDLRETAVMLTEAPALETCGSAEPANFQRPGPNSVVLTTTLDCRGLVVLSDVNYPGWEAWLDGARTSIYEAYGCFRAVVAPAGSHRIEMRYRPASALGGGLVSLIGVAAAFVLLRLSTRLPGQNQ